MSEFRVTVLPLLGFPSGGSRLDQPLATVDVTVPDAELEAFTAKGRSRIVLERAVAQLGGVVTRERHSKRLGG